MRPRPFTPLALAIAAGLLYASAAPAQVVKRAVPVEDDKPEVPALTVPDRPPVLVPSPPVAPPVPEEKPAPPKEKKKPVEPAETPKESPKEEAPPAPGEVSHMTLKAAAVDDDGATPAERPKEKKNLAATVQTDPNARSLMLEIPGPRGQIVDRNGIPFAQNHVVNYLALNFPVLKPAEPQDILSFAHTRIDQVNKLLGKEWSVPDDKLLAHYKDRRWLPLIFSKSGDFCVELKTEEIEKIQPMLAENKGLMLQPCYQRYYPKGDSACHVIGYTGRVRALPTGPIVAGEPATEEPMGRSGLEAAFEERLRGKPGITDLIIGANGTKMSEEIRQAPEPGNNVVLSLDYSIQKYAENALKHGAPNGGAMVVVDVKNGDILAMASNPGYDLNDFIPLRNSYYEKLLKDPKTPLLGRSYQGNYFPASTFKVITALAGLESGAVTPATTFDCASSFTIGDRVFHNWNKDGEGPLTVVGAIKRSCNTWFYQAGLATGTAKIMAMADRMGFGQPVGLPIAGEGRGSLPSDASYMQHFGYKILPGILASISIGQVVEVTPLQAAQCMATLADGKSMPKLRLVKQVQDYNDRVVEAWEPGVRKQVNLIPMARDTVVKGMVAVVNADGGTGRNARLDDIQVAGKTGTAQWKIYPDESKNRNLAWFTGFLPANDPLYAFAVVYEGASGERVSGGAIAAPIVHEVFSNLYKNASPDDPLVQIAKNTPKVEVVNDGPSTGGADGDPDHKGDAAPPPPPPAAEENRGFKGLFHRIFGR